MQTRLALAFALAITAATGAPAATTGEAAQGAPLSAIPWLSESLALPPEPDPDAASPLPPPEPIAVAPLPAPDPDATGLRPARGALWARSDATVLAGALASMPNQSLPAAQDLYTALLLAESTPPRSNGIGPSGFLLARADALLRLGALEPALALIERAGPERPELFRRWFDVSLLTGFEKRACATMAATPSLAPTAAARVFCLAREGRWETAVVTLEATAALGTLSDADADRMARFLDPELFEGEPPMARPDPVTPLLFRVHEALGEPIPTRDLPLAFAHADLRHVIGWKARIEAAERLARVGAIPAETLLAIYSARQPSASGGVWDRVARMQELDIALNSGRAGAVARALGPARSAMAAVGLEPVLAHMVAPRLERLPLTGAAAQSALRLRLLSNRPLALERGARDADTLAETDDPMLAFAAALATGQVARATPPGPRAAAIRAAFTDGRTEPADAALLADGRTGEALLGALRRLAPGAEADPAAAGRSVALLRAAGREDIALQVALQYLLGAPQP